MDQVVSVIAIIGKFGTPFVALAALGPFVFAVVRFRVERSEAHYWKEFDVFHRLVADLVRPRERGDVLYSDQQAAIVFELRSFPRHAEFCLRLLKGVRESWQGRGHERLIREIDLTINFLEAQAILRNSAWWRLRRALTGAVNPA